MLDQLTPAVQGALQAGGAKPQSVCFAAASDLSVGGSFRPLGSGDWLCLTDADLLLVEPQNGTALQVQRYPISAVGELQAETLVVGGVVTAAIDGVPLRLVRYSASQARAFRGLRAVFPPAAWRWRGGR